MWVISLSLSLSISISIHSKREQRKGERGMKCDLDWVDTLLLLLLSIILFFFTPDPFSLWNHSITRSLSSFLSLSSTLFSHRVIISSLSLCLPSLLSCFPPPSLPLPQSLHSASSNGWIESMSPFNRSIISSKGRCSFISSYDFKSFLSVSLHLYPSLFTDTVDYHDLREKGKSCWGNPISRIGKQRTSSQTFPFIPTAQKDRETMRIQVWRIL